MNLQQTVPSAVLSCGLHRQELSFTSSTMPMVVVAGLVELQAGSNTVLMQPGVVS